MHFNRIFSFKKTVYYGEIITHLKKNVHHKTCVAVFIISRNVSVKSKLQHPPRHTPGI